MASTSFGVLITGDSRGAVKAIDLTSKQIKDLESTTEKATRKIKTDTAGASGSFGDMAKSAAKMGAAVGAAAVALGALALRKVITETSESEKVMAQLNATLKSTGGIAGKTAADLSSTASSLQKVTTFTDEAIISAQALLLSFKNIRGDNFDRTTRAILDLSTAMGTDLKSSALQLGKALENPTKGISALTRSGVSFSEAQKDVIKGLAETGRLAEAQTLILAELETQFGGSAAAARDTLGGALLGLQNSWNDLFEVQQTASAGMTDSINALNATISDPAFKSAMDVLIQGLLDVVNYAAKATSALVWMFQSISGARKETLVDLGDDIGAATKALESMEKQGRGNGLAAQAQRAKLKELQKAYDELAASINKASKPVEQLSPILVTAEQRTVKLATANVSLAKSCNTVKASVADLSPIIVTATRKTVDFGKTSEEVASTTSSVWEDVRTTLSGMFFEMAANGESAFDTLVKGFKGMIAKMAAEAATNATLPSVGVGTAGSAAAGGTTGSVGGGSIASGLSMLGGGITAGGQALYESLGRFASNNGMTGLGDMAYTKGLNTTGMSIGLDIGGGLAGGFLGNKVFGQTSGIGAAAGGLAGSILIPIPGVGAAVGSFLGSGLESLFGGDNNGNNRGYTNFNLGTGANKGAGIGKSFDQANVDSAVGLAGVLQQFATAIGGSSLSGNITVGAGQIQYGGKSYGSAEAFLADAYKGVIAGATNLNAALKPLVARFNGAAEEIIRFTQAIVSIDTMSKTNTVTNAINEFTTAQLTASQAYKNHAAILQDQIRAFDGSLSAAENMNTVLYENKTAAYQFAMSIQAIGKSISDMAIGQAASIRESALTPQQLLDKRYDVRDFLAKGLISETDPEKAAVTAQKLLEVNRQIFDSITDEQQVMFAENFAKVADDTASATQYILGKSLDSLKTTQDALNTQVSQMLQTAAASQQQAANTQLLAANIMLQAAQSSSGRGQVAV